MRVEMYLYSQKQINEEFIHTSTPSYVGYAEVCEFDAEAIFNLCNWSHYRTKKPENLHSNITSCGHGLLLINPEDNKYWLALSNGWLVGDKRKIKNYVKNHIYDVIWTEK